MMSAYYTCQVTLILLGPLLTAATSTSQYGVDKSFHRNHHGEIIIPASHIKGKLRMALEELAPFFPENARPDVAAWFGSRSDQEAKSYAPMAGMLRFSDFYFAE